jgi:hypothetical protein
VGGESIAAVAIRHGEHCAYCDRDLGHSYTPGSTGRNSGGPRSSSRRRAGLGPTVSDANRPATPA